MELGVHGGEAFAVYYGVVGAETGEGVDVGVGVVLLETAVVQPEYALGVEAALEFCLYVVGGVAAVGVEVALGGGEYGALTVAFDAAAFEFEVEVVFVCVV